MEFPVYINVGPISIHPHLLFEFLAYFIGFRVYLFTRRRGRIPLVQSMWVVVGAVIGGALGSKLLYWLEDPLQTISKWNDLIYLLEGKTIVGGLLGGLIGVELAKKRIGLRSSTGDDFVIPIMIGMMIGRVGCFLTGLSDKTHGTPTNWFTGVDFGDGVARHPTQLYEIVFLLLLLITIMLMKHNKILRNMERPEGALFQILMFGYLAFRFGVDFIKPTPHPYWGLNNIQLACLAGLIYYANLFRQWKKPVNLS